jgi:hypothetical protein
MASNQAHRPFGGNVNRKGFLEQWGYHAIKGDKARRYVQISTGEVVSRRQAEKRAVGTFEKFAARNERARAGKPSATKKYWAEVRSYAAKTGKTTTEIRKDKTFAALRKDAARDNRSYVNGEKASTTARQRATSQKRLDALYELGELDEIQYDEYIAHYISGEY